MNIMSKFIRLIGIGEHNLRRSRFIRFLFVGGVNTLFGFGVYSSAIILGAAVWFALLAGTVAGTVFNFFTIGGYVFRKILFNRFPNFLIVYILIYVVNLAMIWLASLWFSNKILLQFILILPLSVLSYSLMKKFVFSQKG